MGARCIGAAAAAKLCGYNTSMYNTSGSRRWALAYMPVCNVGACLVFGSAKPLVGIHPEHTGRVWFASASRFFVVRAKRLLPCHALLDGVFLLLSMVSSVARLHCNLHLPRVYKLHCRSADLHPE